MNNAYEKGKVSGEKAIDKTAEDISDQIKDLDSFKTFLIYLWGVRDAYDNVLSDAMGNLITGRPIKDPALRRLSWAVASTMVPGVESAAEKDRLTAINAMLGVIVSTVTDTIKQHISKDALLNALHGMVDDIDMEIANLNGKAD
jgi:hypothetical protein